MHYANVTENLMIHFKSFNYNKHHNIVIKITRFNLSCHNDIIIETVIVKK